MHQTALPMASTVDHSCLKTGCVCFGFKTQPLCITKDNLCITKDNLCITKDSLFLTSKMSVVLRIPALIQALHETIWV